MNQLAEAFAAALPHSKPPALVAMSLYQRQFSVKFSDNSLQGRSFKLTLRFHNPRPIWLQVSETPPASGKFARGQSIVDKNGRLCWSDPSYTEMQSFGQTELPQHYSATTLDKGKLVYTCDIPADLALAAPMQRLTKRRQAEQTPQPLAKLKLEPSVRQALAQLLDQCQRTSEALKLAYVQLADAQQQAERLSKASGGLISFASDGTFHFKSR